MRVGTVIAPYQTDVAHHLTGVAQQMDARLTIELLGLWLASIVFVVAQTGIDRRLDAAELLRHILLDERSHADVDDVTGYQHHIGLLLVD